MALYETPPLDATDLVVLDAIRAAREELSDHLRAPKRWTGNLRRSTQARAIQGSNTIEGYTVSDDDALAAVDDDEPLTADERTWAEILGYRRVLTYVLNVATSPGFAVDAQTLRGLHFMLLEHDLAKSPGSWRTGQIFVRREDGTAVYEGPDGDSVPGLVDELAASLRVQDGEALVRAAMAHLNLVMIHPFRDGNGRMARALQTLVLAQDALLEPTFASIEEWLGANTDAYYQVLAATGRGSWHPENDASLWLKFNLRAHHMQAQTLKRRLGEAAAMGTTVMRLVEERGLPERVFDPLFDAAQGSRVRRPTYVKRSGVEERTATRDLKNLVDAGLLRAHGTTRGRSYTAGDDLRALRTAIVKGRSPLADPYEGLLDEIAREAGRA